MVNLPEDLEYEIVDYDESTFPLAYLITFRTFGTWLHGDERMSVDRDGRNRYGTQRIKPRPSLEAAMKRDSGQRALFLSAPMRRIVYEAIKDLCKRRGYRLLALNVRSNHVHVVVVAETGPERLADATKAAATKRLREESLIKADCKVWSRGRSRRYLWKTKHVADAPEYVLYGQGDREV